MAKILLDIQNEQKLDILSKYLISYKNFWNDLFVFRVGMYPTSQFD